MVVHDIYFHRPFLIAEGGVGADIGQGREIYTFNLCPAGVDPIGGQSLLRRDIQVSRGKPQRHSPAGTGDHAPLEAENTAS